jgi:hypothetical protein
VARIDAQPPCFNNPLQRLPDGRRGSVECGGGS